jgi:hypothetical protein
MSVHRYLLRPRVGASAKVAEVGVADKDRMRSGHIGLFEAEEHVISKSASPWGSTKNV